MMQSDDEHSPPITSKRTRGWAGEEMELAHQRQKILEQQESSSMAKGGDERFSTVNLEQFRNREVGVGYQARGVMRQKTGLASTGSMKIVDMTKKRHRDEKSAESTSSVDSSSERKSSHKKKKKKHKHKRSRSTNSKRSRIRDQSPSPKESNNTGDENIQKYLQCKGIIDFRKELHKILSEASKSKST
eukprot:94853_1